MKGATLVLVFGLTLGGPAEAPQDVDPALKAAAEARTRGRDNADADAYARYTLDDAWIVSPDGGFRATQQNVTDLKAIGKGNGIVRSEVSEERFRMFRDSAIRTYRRAAEGRGGQRSVARFLETWVKQDGQWKLAAEWFRSVVEQ